MLANYRFIGKPNDYQQHQVKGWRETDYRFLNSDVFLQKLTAALKFAPWNFNIVISTSNIKNDVMGYGIEYRHLLERFVHQKYPGLHTDNSITVVYSNNITAPTNYRPMTPWILMHRLWHAVQVSYFDHEELVTADRVIWESLDALYHLIFNPQNKYPTRYKWRTASLLKGAHNTGSLLGIADVMFTMNSARIGQLGSFPDIVPEVIAQYIITGRVKFNLLEEWDFTRLDKRAPSSYDFKSIKERQATINAAIAEAEAAVNAACKVTLDSLVGKITGF